MTKYDKNLKNIDSDKDGLSDFDEINIYKTNPNNPDTDGDGINDCEEIKRGLNPLIKDYFIPNQCNNYRPKALKPKRLFFYGLSALVIKLIVIISVSALPLVAFFSPDYISQESQKIVMLTNEMRQSLNLTLLKENTKLTQSAIWKVQDMAVKQYFAHISPDGKKLSNWFNKSGYDYKFGGENLAMGFSNAEDVMSAWYKSPSHYKNIIDPDFNEIGVGISTGLYNNIETVFIAQHFGFRKNTTTQDVIPITIASTTPQIQKENLINEDTEANKAKEVLAEKQISQEKEEYNLDINIDNKNITQENNISTTTKDILAPVLFKEKTKIFINENSSGNYVVMAEIYLSDDTESAEMFVYDHRVELLKDQSDNTKWSGHLLINNKDIIHPALSASLIAMDNSGNQLITDIDWQNILPIKSSLSDEYSFLKSQKNSPINILFDVSIFYYKVILVLAIILLLINIFVKIKKQYIDIIASSIFLIIFLILLILF
ncbi:MAG TPA: CAP domain-containing protein [bacterium]|nr:CAP domain-containing protein [bacterium]